MNSAPSSQCRCLLTELLASWECLNHEKSSQQLPLFLPLFCFEQEKLFEETVYEYDKEKEEEAEMKSSMHDLSNV